MSNAAFKRHFAALLKKAGDKASLVVRKTALELQSQMIEMTPVDSGRLKSNFQAGVGAVNTDTSAGAGSDAKGRTATVLEGWKVGQTIFLTNSMPYARTVEMGLFGKPPGSANGPKTSGGYSTQAPAGMVRLTVQNYSAALAKAVASTQ